MSAVISKQECVGCELCLSVCPTEAISISDNRAMIDSVMCIDCEACVEECPVNAISMH